jgi:hypothetical protein
MTPRRGGASHGRRDRAGGPDAAAVRGQALARLACPWRFEDYPLAEHAEPAGEEVLGAVVEELDLWHRETIQREEKW